MAKTRNGTRLTKILALSPKEFSPDEEFFIKEIGQVQEANNSDPEREMTLIFAVNCELAKDIRSAAEHDLQLIKEKFPDANDHQRADYSSRASLLLNIKKNMDQNDATPIDLETLMVASFATDVALSMEKIVYIPAPAK